MMIRAYIFFAGAAVIVIGMIGMSRLEEDPAMSFLLGSLTLGGGFLICGLFTIRMLWHGVSGAGVLALLGFGRGLLNFPDAVKYLGGERNRGEAPLLELAVTLICAFLLLRVIGAWNRERTRRLLEE